MNKPLRVVHISLGHNPTDDRIFYKEARSLAKSGYQVTVVAPDCEKVTEKDGVRFGLYKGKSYLRNMLCAYRTALKQHADIYHLHEFELLPFGIWLKYKYKRKVIYDAHETIFWYFIDFSRRSMFIKMPLAIFAQVLEWIGLMFVNHVITVTPQVAEGFRPFQKKIDLVYNYPLLNFFSVPHQPDEKHPIILYHGHIVPARNIELMISAMRFVKAIDNRARLILVGDLSNWYWQKLEALVLTLDLINTIQFQPAIPYVEIPNLISQASIGLSSMIVNESGKRSIQVKPFEFMAMGIPVLGVNVPSIVNYVVESGAGLIVDPLTPENLADRILYLLQNPAVRKTMGDHGRRAVQKRYNWNTTLPALLKVYQELSEC